MIGRAVYGRASEKGLTLVELVSVSAILIALASLTIPVANTMLKTSRTASTGMTQEKASDAKTPLFLA